MSAGPDTPTVSLVGFERKLVARALREVAEAWEDNRALGTNSSFTLALATRAAALDASGGPEVADSAPVAGGVAGKRENAPQRAREGGEKRPPWLTCHDCGLPYSDDGFCDFVVPDDVWARICPEGGVLCAVCMCRRAERAGIRGAVGEFTSGPFADNGYRKPATSAREGGGWFYGKAPVPQLNAGWATVWLPDGHYINGQRTDGVTLTREEVHELIKMLADNGYGRAVRKLRARLGAGE